MKNWAGNISYSAVEVVAPTSMRELHDAIAGAVAAGRKVRALGSRHSFNRIADAHTIIDTRSMPEFLEVGIERTTVTLNGAMTYGRLVELIAPLGFAVHNLASLPHISIAGAIATGTHGSGDRNGNLATSVAALQILTASGEILSLSRSDTDFAGAVVSLGALGVVTSVTLDVEPAFEVEQRAFDGPSLTELGARFDDVFSAAYSVSAFTMWQGKADQVWVKHRTGEDRDHSIFDSMTPALEKRHPIMELDAEACTEQFGVPGLWSERLPHFKMDFTPSAGDEIQSEFFVARSNASAAIAAIDAVGSRLQGALLVGEIRTVASDELLMSPHVGRDSVAFHFTWRPDQPNAEAAAGLVATVLGDLDVRPHWGKVFAPTLIDLGQFEGLDAFLSLVERTDPDGVFRNTWFDETFAIPPTKNNPQQ